MRPQTNGSFITTNFEDAISLIMPTDAEDMKMRANKRSARTTYARVLLLTLSPWLLCIGLVVFGRICGGIYNQRATELQQSLKPGMSRSEVYHKMDAFFPHVIETPTVNEPITCSPNLPGKYFLESARFLPPYIFGPDGMLVVMCFDNNGTLVYVE